MSFAKFYIHFCSICKTCGFGQFKILKIGFLICSSREYGALRVYMLFLLLFCSHCVVSRSLWPHGLQYAKLPCPPLSPRVCSDSYALIRCCCLCAAGYQVVPNGPGRFISTSLCVPFTFSVGCSHWLAFNEQKTSQDGASLPCLGYKQTLTSLSGSPSPPFRIISLWEKSATMERQPCGQGAGDHQQPDMQSWSWVLLELNPERLQALPTPDWGLLTDPMS